ncbi:MAG TPA: hypothetical protein VH482_17785 [Thermomicrobiales bacterium]|jgi:hypothetical protein
MAAGDITTVTLRGAVGENYDLALIELADGRRVAATADLPATRGLAITPDDSSDLPFVTRYLSVGQAGNVALIYAGDDDPVTLSLAVGPLYNFAVKRVLATGTTADDIVGLA